MFVFIVCQFILDKSKSVFVYEFLFRDGKFGVYLEYNEEKVKYIFEYFYLFGFDDISGEKMFFIMFLLDIIILCFFILFNFELVVVELVDLIDNISGLFEVCQYIK